MTDDKGKPPSSDQSDKPSENQKSVNPGLMIVGIFAGLTAMAVTAMSARARSNRGGPKDPAP